MSSQHLSLSSFVPVHPSEGDHRHTRCQQGAPTGTWLHPVSHPEGLLSWPTSGLSSSSWAPLKAGPETRILAQEVYLGGDSRKHYMGGGQEPKTAVPTADRCAQEFEARA